MSCSLLFMGCRHDDVLENDPNQSHEETGLKGKSFVVTQTELEAKYAGNKSLNSILQKEFKTDNGLIKTNSVDEEAAYGVYIDLDYVTVFESDQIHTITYHVTLEEQEETDEIQEVYNLMYFSHDYETYYVTLLRYDFSQISFQEFVMNPDIYRAQLAFLPLNDIENIYENIRYSFSNVNQTAGKTAYNYEVAVGLQRLEYQPCSVTVNVSGIPCQRCGLNAGEVKNGRQCANENPATKPVPGYSYTDSRPCSGAPGSGAPDGHGGGPGGGGGGYSPVRPNPNPNPITTYPIKKDGNIFKSNLVLYQINTGNNTDRNSKILNSLVENNRVTLKELYDKRNEPREYGYRFSKTKTGDLIKVTAPGALPLVTNTQLGVKSLRGASVIGFAHTHTNTDTQPDGSYVYPMFSHTDIMALFEMVNKNPSIDKSPPDLFVGLIVDAGFYVIMFPNDVTLDNVATKYSNFAIMNGNKMTANNQAQAWIGIQDDLQNLYDLVKRGEKYKQNIRYEKALLKTLKKYNLNVNVYKMPDDGGQFNAKWRALSLPANTNDTFDNTQPIETILN